ncbi:MAG: asparagine--tRNA ligase [Euryarchaeota archaeon]|nr:asparagine--tRNA ligase [Euryarchaeota archaeon]
MGASEKIGLDPVYAGPVDETRTAIADILAGKKTGKDVVVRGWIHRTRSKGKLAFLVVRDATGTIQCTLKQGVVPDDQFTAAAAALMESSIALTGEVKEDPRAPGGFEIGAKEVQVVHAAEVFPIKEHQSTELLMDLRHLWVRSQEQRRIQRIKHHMLRAVRDWFHANGFTEVTPSVITTNAAEGGSDVFKFDYFGQEAYLSQTAQMYLEALIFAHEKVYSLTPSFRAEKSRTLRHLTEFNHLEAEMAWMGSEDNMKVQESLITYTAHTVARTCHEELTVLGRDPEDLLAIKAPFERLPYNDAVTFLNDNGFPDFKWGEDFGAPHERKLVEGRTQPVFITNFPKKIKAFYMKEDPDDARVVLCNDCLAPEGYGEIVGASEREVDIDEIVRKLKEEGATLANYEWYLDLRRYGSVRHSGFGLGLERLLLWFTKQEHVRDMTPFPRTTNRAYP